MSDFASMILDIVKKKERKWLMGKYVTQKM